MLDANTQARFARSCSDAMVGYADAATAAYASMTTQAIDMWGATMRSMSPRQPEPRSWYRHPDERARLPAVNPFLAAWDPVGLSRMQRSPAPGFAFGFWPAAQSNPSAALDGWFAPWSTWLAMWSGTRAPVAWPMAFVMVANGMPQSVAVPAAEAHAAVLDAANIAAQELTQVFSVYRSESGYAMAQVIAPPRSDYVVARDERPVSAVSAFWPWLH